MSNGFFGDKGKIIERALLYNRIKYPKCSISEIYQIVHDTTGSPIESIRRVKSTSLAKWKDYIAILEDEE